MKDEQYPSLSSNRKPKSINPSSKKLNSNNNNNNNNNNQQQQQKSVKPNVNSEKELFEKISSVSVAVDADQSIVDISKTKMNSDYALESDENVAVQIPEESARVSPVSEAFVFYDDQSSLESYISSLDQHISPSSTTYGSLEAIPLSSKSPAETTPLSSITTEEMTPSSTTAITTDAAAIHGATIDETKSVKLESLIKHLRESMFQVLHSSDIDSNHKKLLDALVKMVIEQFCSSHKERGSVVSLFSKKVKLVVLSYLLVMLLGSAGFFLFSDVQSCYHGPPPT